MFISRNLISTLITAISALFFSVNAHALYFDINLNFATAQYYTASGLATYGVDYTVSTVGTGVAGENATTVTWGNVDGTRSYSTSSFTFTENDHIIGNNDAANVVNHGSAWDYGLNGYRSGDGFDEIRFGTVDFTNGETPFGLELTRIVFTDWTITQWNGSAVGSGPADIFSTHSLGIAGGFEVNINTTQNNATPISNPSNADELCAEAYGSTTGGTPFSVTHTSCAEILENTTQSFDAWGFLGSIYFSGFTPVSSGAFVTNTYPDGTVVTIPEPTSILILLLGLLLMYFSYKPARSK